MTRTLLALVFSLLLGSIGPLSAEPPIPFTGVEATNGAQSDFAKIVQGELDVMRGWKIAPGGAQSAVYRPATPIPRGRFRIWVTLYGFYGTQDLDGFTVSVTSDENPSLASQWKSLFPVTILADKGEVSRSGYRVRMAGDSVRREGDDARTAIRVDGILTGDVTAVKLEVWPLAQAIHPVMITSMWASRAEMDSTNIALGCPVRASHDVGADQDPMYLTDGLAGTFAHPAVPHPPEPFFFEIDLGRQAILDHITLVNRAEGATMGRLSQLRLELFEEKPSADSTPVWTCRHRYDGTSSQPGESDRIRAANGKGEFRGRYLRITSDSPVAYAPQLADVGVYESIVPVAVNASAKGHSIPMTSRIQVYSDGNPLSFTTVQPKLRDAFRLGAQGKIIGYDRDWNPIGANETLDYPGIPPGNYIFEAQLCHTDGIWNDASLRIPIVVLKPWWQQPLTHVGAGILAVGIGAWVTRHIVRRRMQKRLADMERGQELSNERRRIARDMHDVVGARLTQLAVLQDLYAEDSDLSPDSRKKLEELKETTREAIASLDQTVWAINPRNDTLQGLADYLCHSASEYLRPIGIHVRQDVPDSWPEITVGAQKRHELLHAFKEALQNIVKHAAATTVNLRLRLIEHELFIEIEDNGRGLPADLSGVEKNGLENMSARLAELGGACSVRSRESGGTLVKMNLPL